MDTISKLSVRSTLVDTSGLHIKILIIIWDHKVNENIFCKQTLGILCSYVPVLFLFKFDHLGPVVRRSDIALSTG